MGRDQGKVYYTKDTIAAMSIRANCKNKVNTIH